MEDLPEGLQVAVEAALTRDSYYVTPRRDHPDEEVLYQAHNRAQGLRVGFSTAGIHIAPRGSEVGLGMKLTGIGYRDGQQGVSDASLVASGNRIDYYRTTSQGVPFTEWYVNGPEGIEQGFTLPAPPVAKRAGDDPLVLEFAVSDGLKPQLAQDGGSISFANGVERVLGYSELHAFDALGRELPSRMDVRKGRIALVVDDGEALYPLTVDPLVTTEQVKLTASDAVAFHSFGVSVALSGDTALIGAPGDNDASIRSGSAYVFVRSGTGWIEQAKLTASDAAENDEFGNSVALSGDTALVGASLNDNPGQFSGSAYVFVRPATGWSGDLTEQAKLTASDTAAGDRFGYSVGLSGDTALVGAIEDDDAGSDSGSAYVFVRPATGWSGDLTEQAKLIASDAAAEELFGFSVALSGDTALVGALDNHAGQFSGSAYVFVRPATGWSGNLTEQAKLIATDAAAFDNFGISVALSGDTALIGARLNDSPGSNSGSAYVFVRPATGWSGNLTEQAKLTASDAVTNERFGSSVALSGDTALVGASNGSAPVQSGSAYVFVRPATGWSGNLTEQAKLTAIDAARSDNFGFSVALSGDTALVGAVGDDDFTGSAYVFDLDRGTTEIGPDVTVDPIDSTTGNTSVSLAFDDVTGAGTTTLTTTSTGTPPPSGFKLGSPPTYFEIDTTATFTGCVEICIDYSDLSFGNESQLKLFHQLPDGTWEDITIPSTAENPNPDTVNKIICGETGSFSAFALFELADPVADIQSLIDKVVALNVNNGIINSFDAKLQAAADALVDVNNNNDVAAINALNAFINAVQAQSGNKILVADADQLIADAQAIIDLLNG